MPVGIWRFPAPKPGRRTREHRFHGFSACAYGAITLCDQAFQDCSASAEEALERVHTPHPRDLSKAGSVWSIPVSLAANKGIAIVFFSCAY